MTAKSSSARVAVRKSAGPLSADALRKIDAYWRAANYLAVGQSYVLGNPLQRRSTPRRPNRSPGRAAASSAMQWT